jgi:hypothetical protein
MVGNAKVEMLFRACPEKVELVILTTAKTLGLEIPMSRCRRGVGRHGRKRSKSRNKDRENCVACGL